MFYPKTGTDQVKNQIDQLNEVTADPDKYALDLCFRSRHWPRIQEGKQYNTFKI